MRPDRKTRALTMIAALLFAVACGGGGGDPGNLSRIGGTIENLHGSGLVLQLNDAHELHPAAGDARFQFDAYVAQGGIYSVTVAQHPTGPAQVCSVDKGVGLVHGDVTDVAVTCATSGHHVSAKVSGLAGSGLVVQLGSEQLRPAQDGSYGFTALVAATAHYEVSVVESPSTQLCTAGTNASGTMGDQDVVVDVTCRARSFSVGGTVAGLARSGLVLKWGAQTVSVAQDGRFTFPMTQPDGTAYAITVATQPKPQICQVFSGRGTIGMGDVSDVAVVCDGCGSGWCREVPRWAPGTTFQAVSGTRASDVWAVGASGIIVHWDGASWVQVPSQTTETLYAVWALSDEDAWAVGTAGTILRWNGRAWSAVPSGTASALNGVWASAPDDAWAVGQAGELLHWTGASWAKLESGATTPLYRVWASSATDVWAAGARGVLHWNGTAWSSSSTVYQSGVWGTGPNDVWGWSGLTYSQWNGSTWSTASWRPSYPENCVATSATTVGGSANDIWLFAATYETCEDGGTWDSAYQWSSGAWRSVTLPHTYGSRGVGLRGVWGGSLNGMWAVGGSGTILERHNFGAWTAVTGEPAWQTDVWVAEFGSAISVGGAGVVLEWNGTTWTARDSGVSADLYGTWISPTGVAWAVGSNGTIVRAGSPTWTTVPSGVTAMLLDIWGTSDSNVWVAGTNGTVLRWNGTAWSAVSTPFGSTTLTAIWGTGANDVWVAGAGGTIGRWNGSSWTAVSSGTTQGLAAIWGNASNDVWAVGSVGTIRHWNGSAWSGVTSPVGSGLTSVWGTGPNDVWAVGQDAAIHFDGTSWSVASSNARGRAIQGAGANDLWVAGAQGVTRYRR